VGIQLVALLYRGARDLGNLEAAKKGPAALGKRYVHRSAYRKTTIGKAAPCDLGVTGGKRGAEDPL
jgi:hypothetical protein